MRLFLSDFKLPEYQKSMNMKSGKFTYVFTALLALSLMTNSYAQSDDNSTTDNFNRSKSYVGLSTSGGWGGYFGFTGNIGAKYGYYIYDRLALGADLNYEVNANQFKYFRPGIILKYHFNDKRISPFLESGLYQAFGKHRIDNSEEWTSDSYTEGRVGFGLNFQGLFNDKVSFEPMVGYSTKKDVVFELRFLYHF